MTSYVHIRELSKSYGSHRVLDRFSLDINKGNFVTLLGPSGCGKSTTLRLIAGLVKEDMGLIELGGRDLTKVAPYRRNTILVFQSYALFPHMTIAENVAYGLHRRKMGKQEIERRVHEMLCITRLEGFGKRYPNQLSGGQQQRAALARSLVLKPDLLLLDEPLSNLDAKLRNEMRIEIRLLHEKLGLTTLFVTHDQEEAFSISDEIIVMNKGQIIQQGKPEDIFLHPKNSFVAEFTGIKNLFEGSYAHGIFLTSDGMSINFSKEVQPSIKRYGLRPANVLLNPASEFVDNAVDAQIELKTYRGNEVELLLKLAQREIISAIPSNNPELVGLHRGDNVRIGWSSSCLIPLED